MPTKYTIIANWKMQFSESDVKSWLTKFSENYQPKPSVRVIIAPSLIHLPLVVQSLNAIDQVDVFAQNVACFAKGPFTGEVGAFQLQDMGVGGALVGHSERRINQHELDQEIALKVQQLDSFKLESTVCVSDLNEVKALAEQNLVPTMYAYEPLAAIGTGTPADPNDVSTFIGDFNRLGQPEVPIVYGGSISASTVSDYLNIDQIYGLLVGGASLNPDEFLNLIDEMVNYAVSKL